MRINLLDCNQLTLRLRSEVAFAFNVKLAGWCFNDEVRYIMTSNYVGYSLCFILEDTSNLLKLCVNLPLKLVTQFGQGIFLNVRNLIHHV